MSPYENLKLYGYNEILNDFIKIYNNKKIPNKILLSGKKGIGKSTLCYHLINYIFSLDEDNKYDLENAKISLLNKSYNLVKNNSHPNFFKISLKNEKESIEISQIREMINFTNKSSFNNKEQIVIIDDVECLNLNSINALLKIIEEPKNNVLFFLIFNNEKKIFDTLKSRCIEYKLQIDEKVTASIVNYIYNNDIFDQIPKEFKNYFLSPLFYINLINFCKNNNLTLNELTIDFLMKFIIKNNSYKKNDLVKQDIKLYIEIFFRNKINNVKKNEFFYLYNYFNKKFHLLKKFNLDLDSYLLEFNSKLLNE